MTNGASELLGQVFGAKGQHARSAFGVAQIPLGACVEIELIAEIDLRASLKTFPLPHRRCCPHVAPVQVLQPGEAW